MPGSPAARVDDRVGAHAGGAGRGSRFLESALLWAAMGAVATGVVVGAALMAPALITGAVGLALAEAVGGIGSASLAVLSGALSGAALGIQTERQSQAAEPTKKLGGGCGRISEGSSNVFVAGKAAATVDRKSSHSDKKLSQGSEWVYCNGKPMSRIGDASKCGGTIITGASSVAVGGPPAGSTDGSSTEAPPEFAFGDPDTWDWDLIESGLSTAGLVLGVGAVGKLVVGAVVRAGGVGASLAAVQTAAGLKAVGKTVGTVAASVAIGNAAMVGGGVLGGPIGAVVVGAVSQVVPAGALGAKLRFKSKLPALRETPLVDVTAHADIDAGHAQMAAPVATPIASPPPVTDAAAAARDASKGAQQGQPPTPQFLRGPNEAVAAHEPARAAHHERAPGPPPPPRDGPPALVDNGRSRAVGRRSANGKAARASSGEAPAKPDCPSCGAADRGFLGDGTKRIGEGQQSYVRLSSSQTHVIKRDRYFQGDKYTKDDGTIGKMRVPPVPTEKRRVLARQRVELVQHLRKHPALAAVIPEFRQALNRQGQEVPGVVWVEYASRGKPLEELDPEIQKKAKQEVYRYFRLATDQAGMLFGAPSIQHGIKTEIDPLSTNFRFDDDGRVLAWFDPVYNQVVDPHAPLPAPDAPTVWNARTEVYPGRRTQPASPVVDANGVNQTDRAGPRPAPTALPPPNAAPYGTAGAAPLPGPAPDAAPYGSRNATAAPPRPPPVAKNGNGDGCSSCTAKKRPAKSSATATRAKSAGLSTAPPAAPAPPASELGGFFSDF